MPPPAGMTIKPPRPNIFPGAVGMALLVADESLELIWGNVSRCRYLFVANNPLYVDKRDMPGMPKDRLRKVA